MTVKDALIESCMEQHEKINQQTGDVERANAEWKKNLTCSRVPNLGAQNDLDTAAFELASCYYSDGMRKGFDLACRTVVEILAAALKGGETA